MCKLYMYISGNYFQTTPKLDEIVKVPSIKKSISQATCSLDQCINPRRTAYITMLSSEKKVMSYIYEKNKMHK